MSANLKPDRGEGRLSAASLRARTAARVTAPPRRSQRRWRPRLDANRPSNTSTLAVHETRRMPAGRSMSRTSLKEGQAMTSRYPADNGNVGAGLSSLDALAAELTTRGLGAVILRRPADGTKPRRRPPDHRR